MNTTTEDRMPKDLMAAVRWAGERMADTRNRAVDLYRAIAISFVIIGHWLLVTAVIHDGEATWATLLAEER